MDEITHVGDHLYSGRLYDELIQRSRELSALHAVGVKEQDVYNGAMHYLGEMYEFMEEEDDI